MEELQELKLYRMPEMEKLLGTDRHTIVKLINSGLLKARKMGHGWRSSGQEIKEFYATTAGMDISNENKIILAGQQKSGRSTTPNRKANG